MPAATSAGVTPASYSRALPSGNVREIVGIWPAPRRLAPTKRPVAGKVLLPFAAR